VNEAIEPPGKYELSPRGMGRMLEQSDRLHVMALKEYHQSQSCLYKRSASTCALPVCVELPVWLVAFLARYVAPSMIGDVQYVGRHRTAQYTSTLAHNASAFSQACAKFPLEEESEWALSQTSTRPDTSTNYLNQHKYRYQDAAPMFSMQALPVQTSYDSSRPPH
jgi:hypothetical protein